MANPAVDGHLPEAADLSVLMIGLSDYILTGKSGGDVRDRHIEYAQRISHLHMIVYSPRSHDLQPTQLSRHLTVYPTRSLSRPTFLWDAYRIGAQLCRQHKIDVITTQDPFTTGLIGVWLKRRFSIPLDVQNHSDFFDNQEWISEKPLRYGLFNHLGKWVARRADTHRVLTEFEKAKYSDFGVSTERIVVLSTPTRLGRFTPDGPPTEQDALCTELGIPADAPVLLWVGRPVPIKRVDILLEAFAIVRRTHAQAHLILVGDFSQREDLTARAAQQDVTGHVHIVGQVQHANLPAYYRLCDVYVHSSVYEGLGKVMIEAQASARPVVSTRTAGGQEIVIDGETGLLVEPENPVDIAHKVIILLDDPDRAAQMGNAGRSRVLEQFDHEQNLDAVIETWRRTAAYGAA